MSTEPFIGVVSHTLDVRLLGIAPVIEALSMFSFSSAIEIILFFKLNGVCRAFI